MNLEIELMAQHCQLSVFDFTILSFTPRKGSFDFFFFFFLHERGFGPLGPFLFFLGFTGSGSPNTCFFMALIDLACWGVSPLVSPSSSTLSLVSSDGFSKVGELPCR